MDSWVLWNLLGRRRHLTDVSNASRTFLLNLKTLQWDSELLEYSYIIYIKRIFGIPKDSLAEVLPSGAEFG